MNGFTRQSRCSRAARLWAVALRIGALASICALPAPAAVAQATAPEAAAPGGATTADYDAIVLKALAAYDAQRWDEARRLFEWAHGLLPTARTLRTIGMSAFNQGDYVVALQNLEAALIDTRKPLTDEQRVHVAELIERANLQVGRFALRLSPAGARLLVDGKSPVLIGDDQLLLTAGQHDLTVRAEGYQPLSRKLQVKPRDRATLELRLVAEGSTSPVAAVATAGATPNEGPPVGPAEPPPADQTPFTLGIIALSVGAAGLIASGITASLALSEKDDLDAACPERNCPPTQHDGVDRYDTLRLVSGLSLLGGVVFAGLGTVLLLTADGEAESVHAVVGLGSAGIAGRF